MMRKILAEALHAGQLREIDLHCAMFVNDLAGNPSDELLLASALVSRAVGDGHICLPLATVAGEAVFAPDMHCRAPGLQQWRRQLLASRVVGPPGAREPLILDADDNLYLARYHRCEMAIADDILNRSRGVLPVDMDRTRELFSRIFPGREEQDLQKAAAAVSILKRFSVISGGPGTGKTTTVARILALQQKLAGRNLRIGLAAPTGKAAVRLQESILKARETLDDDLAALVPVETKTLHRLLGYMPRKGIFRYNRHNRLALDLLVLDEASMIDVPLMAALVDALPEEAKIVMLGDRDQLTSVESGSLFGDICSVGEPGWSSLLCERVRQATGWAPKPVCPEETFGDSVVLLRKSYRFGENSGIGLLAQAVNNNDGKGLRKLVEQDHRDLLLVGQDLLPALEKHLQEGFAPCFGVAEPQEALESLAGFRILCAVREGPFGVTGINKLAERTLRRCGLIKGTDPWYPGQPLIIRSNHYELNLFNGDTGVVWPDIEGKLWAWFSRVDGSLHQVQLSRLPEHDTAYAITVHQSQGSEFNEVLFLLPAIESRVLCRELLYTGITRASRRLMVFGDPDLLAKAMKRSVVRYSGLGKKLWADDGKTILEVHLSP